MDDRDKLERLLAELESARCILLDLVDAEPCS